MAGPPLATARARIQRYKPTASSDNTAVLLRALLDNVPVDPRNLCEDIIGADTDDKLKDLGQQYFYGLLLPLRAAGHRTPLATMAYSPDEAVQDNGVDLEAARDQSRLKKLVAERDGYRCVFTGWPADEYPGAEEQDLPTYPIVAAHIISYFWICGKPENRPVAWTVVERYTGIKLEDINGKNINKLENALTATQHAHTRFGNLEIWLEAIPDKPNSYYLRKAQPRLLSVPDGHEITFAAPPFPDPRFLALHAACARVLHATGLAEEIDKLLEDLEARQVLSADGSSAQLLTCALSMVPS